MAYGGFIGNFSSTNTGTTLSFFMMVSFTVFTSVGRIIGLGNNDGINDAYPIEKMMISTQNGLFPTLYRGASINYNSNLTLNTPYLVTGYFDGINGYLGVNGTYVSFGSTGNFNILKYGIGVSSYSSIADIGNAKYGEVLIYNNALATLDRQKMEGYLAWKWGTNTSLPTNHPYYVASPTSINPPTVTSVTTFATGLTNPLLMVFDTNQNLYCTNNGNNTISKITPGGTVSTFVSSMSSAYGITMDSTGNFYCSNINQNTISKITSNGSTITTFATGLSGPAGIVCDANNNIYCCNNGANTILKITSSGTVSTFCSSGVAYCMDLLFDSSQNLYCLCYGSFIAKISSGGIATTLYTGLPGSSKGFCMSSSGNIYVSSTSTLITKITPTGTMSTYNPPGFTLSSYYTNPYGLKFDANQYLYICNNITSGTIIKVGDPNI